MADFNFAQFLGGILKGGGESLGYGMPVIPRKPNAPPTIEMTPSQTAASDIVKGAGSEIALSRPVVRPGGGAGVISPSAVPHLPRTIRHRDMMFRPEDDDYLGGRMRQMRSGGITDPLEKVEVHDRETVQGLPDGRVVVTPAEETVNVSQESSTSPQPPAEVSADVREQMVNPQYSEATNELATDRSADISADRPPVMSIPDTVKPGMDDEEGVQKAILDNLEIKPSPWKDLGAALIQAGDNYFNNKKDPIRTWGEIQRDKKIAPLAARLALIKDAKASRQASEEKAARIGLINQQAKTIPIDDELKAIDIERKRTADDRKYEIQARTQTWKEADRAEYWKQEEIKQAAIQRRDAATVRIAEARQKELERHNLVTERQGDKRIEQGDKRIEGARLSREDLNKYRGASLQLRQAGSAAGLTPKQAQDIADRKTKLKAALTEKVRAGKMTQADMDEILNEKVDAGFGRAEGSVDK